jgi:hypothetical protein
MEVFPKKEVRQIGARRLNAGTQTRHIREDRREGGVRTRTLAARVLEGIFSER